MTYDHAWSPRTSAMDRILSALLSFPVACFTLTVLTDLAYWRTLNLLFLHFSEWLLVAGLVFGIAAALVMLVDFLLRRVRPTWPAALVGIAVLLLATLNSFIHTADGWTAVMPYGLTVSVLTVIAMIAMAALDRRGGRHV